MPNTFRKIEDEFKTLKNKFTQGKISKQEFKEGLKKLRLDDKKGKCWTIGARTGKWYCYDGESWIEAQPPSLQEGKAICIYCGYENELKNEVCDYCGGNLGGGEYSCPKCGNKLNSPTQECPECKKDEWFINQQQKEGMSTTAKKTTWKNFTSLDSEICAEEEALADDGGSNFILRFMSPSSFIFFFGIVGLIFGIIAGVFVGISSLLPGFVENLPDFLHSLHGQLLGGIVFGLIGGVAGFICMGLFGLINTAFINLILSFFGGIKIRLEKN